MTRYSSGSRGQIYLHPANPYGFDVNWAADRCSRCGMPRITRRWPVIIWRWARDFFGWGEIGLHLAFLLPALAVVLGTYRLAGHFCKHPMLAALAMLFTPVFVVSSLTVMCDMLMLAFWVWSAVLWVEGMGTRRLRAAGRVRPAHRRRRVDEILRRVPDSVIWAHTA